MGLFDQFLGSSDPLIQQAASLLNDATNQYKAGSLTKDEYNELCGNILDFNQISATITDMSRKQEIWDAFQAMMNIVEAATSL